QRIDASDELVVTVGFAAALRQKVEIAVRPRDEAVDADPDKDRYLHSGLLWEQIASGLGLRATNCGLQASRGRLLAARGSKCSLRFPQPVECSVRIFGKRAFGQNLQVLLVVFPGFGFITEFFLALGKTEAGNGVVVFVVESVLVALERA